MKISPVNSLNYNRTLLKNNVFGNNNDINESQKNRNNKTKQNLNFQPVKTFATAGLALGALYGIGKRPSTLSETVFYMMCFAGAGTILGKAVNSINSQNKQ